VLFNEVVEAHLRDHRRPARRREKAQGSGDSPGANASPPSRQSIARNLYGGVSITDVDIDAALSSGDDPLSVAAKFHRTTGAVFLRG